MSTQQLLEAISRTVALSPAVREAFSQVDRAHFVPHYYRQRGMDWTLEPAGPEVYEDRALTIQMTNSLPSSSSSQPSIMALMLEALDVRPGQRVLEVGTGTGYHAALLASLVKVQGQVISLDLDETLIQQARAHIKSANVQAEIMLVQADGREGYAPASPFDRIILTAGTRHLEPAWVEQLQIGGMLVGNLRGRLCSVLFALQKEQTHRMRGKLLAQDAYFMEMHGEEYPTLQVPDWQPYDRVALHWRQADEARLQTMKQAAFLFFLQGQHPQMELHLRAFGTPEHYELCTVFQLDESTAIIHDNGRVEARGVAWDHVIASYDRYRQIGEPSLEDYHLFADVQTGCPRVSSCRGDEQWCVC